MTDTVRIIMHHVYHTVLYQLESSTHPFPRPRRLMESKKKDDSIIHARTSLSLTLLHKKKPVVCHVGDQHFKHSLLHHQIHSGSNSNNIVIPVPVPVPATLAIPNLTGKWRRSWAGAPEVGQRSLLELQESKMKTKTSLFHTYVLVLLNIHETRAYTAHNSSSSSASKLAAATLSAACSSASDFASDSGGFKHRSTIAALVRSMM